MGFFNRILIALVLSLAFISSSSWAYYAVLDNGEILPSGHYKLTGDGQIFTDAGGIDLGARFDSGLNDSTGLRAEAGFGKTNYYFGGLIKWMPIPDIDNQPAIGLNAGLRYGHPTGESQMSVRVEPLVSKKLSNLNTPVIFTPYASLPLSLRMRNTNSGNKNDVAWQLAIGTQIQTPKWKTLQFMAEIGVDIDNAPSYIAAGAVFYFDSENGFSLN